MMRTINMFVVLIFSMVVFAVSSEIDGKWKGKVTGPMGDMEIEFNLKADGSTLTGTVTGPRGEQSIQNGKIDGNNFSFDTDMGGNLVTRTGTVKGDILKVTMQQFGVEFELKRAVEKIDINGSWLGSMPMPDGGMGGPGNMEMIFIFEVKNDTLTGSVKSPMGDMSISNGKIDGSEFYFDVDAGGMVIGHQCTVEGDSIKMKIVGGPGDMGMTLKKVESK